MTDREQLEKFLQFATRTAERAGEIALRYFRRPLTVDNKSAPGEFDPVTAADREIEIFIRAEISARFPDHSLFGEEQGRSTGSGRYTWVIDPIDGTRSFISGSPLWGILLGLMEAHQCILGVMRQPYLGETFSGSTAGAFLDREGHRQALATRGTLDLSAAILYSTHPVHFTTPADYDAFLRVADHCMLMRYGGDCYAYSLLAQGQIDLVIESDLNAYDIMPLIPLIEAAGGMVTDWHGGSAAGGGNVIAAANSELHSAALKILHQ